MKKIAIFLINLYQKTANILEKQGYLRKRCRFYPSCSEYSKQAFIKYSPPRAVFLTIKRVFRCGPWSSGGVDPLP